MKPVSAHEQGLSPMTVKLIENTVTIFQSQNFFVMRPFFPPRRTSPFTTLCMAMCGLFFLHSCAEPETSLTETDVAPRTTFYSVGSALQYLNDSLNIWYCRPGDQYDKTVVFIDTFLVDINGFTQISKTDLQNLATEIAETAGDHFYPRAATNKAPFMFEVRQAGNPGGGVVPVASWFIMEEDDPTSESDAYPYEETWPYGSGLSIGCSGEPTGVDAPDLFRRDLREEIVYGWKNGKGNYAYNQLYTICFNFQTECGMTEMPYSPSDELYLDLLNTGDEVENDNFYDHLLYTSNEEYPDYHLCISPNEMNFYFESMRDLGEDQLGSSGVGNNRVVVNVEVGYETITGEYWFSFHGMHVFYAHVIQALQPQVSLPSTCCP